MNPCWGLFLLWVLLALTTATRTLATESSDSVETPPTPSESYPASDGPPKDFSEKYHLRVVTNEAARSVITGKVTNAVLNGGDIHGGSIGLMMAELNWYLHSQVRWMINTGGGHVTGGPSDGNIVLFQTRVGVDF